MSIRIPLFDPDRALDSLMRLVPRSAGRLMALIWFVVVLPAPILAAIHWPDLTENLTERVLSLQNLLAVACVYPVVKLFHELGHALAVKSGHGEVRDVGLMVVTLVPVPYVDASASTAFRSKWRRALVAAAGILVEIFIAAIALDVWIISEPGLVQTVAFNTMLVAGVSTVLFNGNPLLRFDGYFVLCDLAEMPNLAGRASAYWSSLVNRRLFGAPQEPTRTTRGERAWFILYAPLALAYQLSVTIAAAAFLATKFFGIGVALALWGSAVNIVWPLVRGLWRVMFDPRLQVRRGRAFAVLLLGTAGVAAMVFSFPLPLHTVAEGVVWLPDDSIIRAARDGVVTAIDAPPGQAVREGDTLFTSVDPVSRDNVAVAAAEVASLQAKLDADLFNDRVQAAITRQEIAVKEADLDRQKDDLDRLTLRSGVKGAFVVPQAEDLEGRFARRGTVLGYVTPDQDRIVRIVVDQADIDLVRTRVRGVDVLLLERPEKSYPARLLREVPAATDNLPSKSLTQEGGGRLAADPRDQNRQKTLQRTFQFDVLLPPEARVDEFGGRALIRFDHGEETLAQQCYRRLRQLFLSHFDA